MASLFSWRKAVRWAELDACLTLGSGVKSLRFISRNMHRGGAEDS
jgi:hypothetical protein